MGVSEDSESIVSGNAVNRDSNTLPLTIDLYSSGVGCMMPLNLSYNVKYIHVLCNIDFLSFSVSHFLIYDKNIFQNFNKEL